jgi:hypothetical protein
MCVNVEVVACCVVSIVSLVRPARLGCPVYVWLWALSPGWNDKEGYLLFSFKALISPVPHVVVNLLPGASYCATFLLTKILRDIPRNLCRDDMQRYLLAQDARLLGI